MSTHPALRRLRPLLGTFVEVGVASADEAANETAIGCAFGAMEQIQRALSFQDPDSELSRINRSHGEWIDVSACTARVLRLARAMMAASGHLFDCTVGGELVARGVLPRHPGTHAVTSSGTAANIDVQARRVRLRRPVQLTLDGIAKGYAVDIGIAALHASGAPAGWINAGGDLRAFGTIAVPVYRREIDGSLTTLGGLQNAAVATSVSGSARDNRFPGVIVGSASHPPRHGVWTVVAHRAWRADALTKVAALAPENDRQRLLQQLGGRLVEGPETLQ